MEKEKKQIKISLWAFYVLMAGIVILIGAVIIGGIGIKKQMNNLEQGQVSLTNQVTPEQNNEISKVQNKVENVSQNDVNAVKEGSLKDATFDDTEVQKCLAYLGIEYRKDENILVQNSNMIGSLYYEAGNNQNKLTKNNISNGLILSLAVNYAYDRLENENHGMFIEKSTFSRQDIQNNILTIFGRNIKYVDSSFDNGMQLGGGYPDFEKVTYSSNTYTVEGLAYETGTVDYELISLLKDSSTIKKDSNNIIITIPIAFRISNGEMDYFKTDYYSDLDLSKGKTYEDTNNDGRLEEYPIWNEKNILKNLIAHNYYSSGFFEEEYPEEYERLKQELAVNDGIGTIEENMDKLHKIKMTFTKDDTNEYHFESFEIID